ncbi:hypothetical protein D0Y65_023977, partial [Glycine soja]
QRCKGILPKKLLTRKLKIFNCCRLSPIHEGTGPDNKFSPTSNITKLEQFFNVSGNSPLKLLFRWTKASSSTRVHMDCGIFSDNLFFVRSRNLTVPLFDKSKVRMLVVVFISTQECLQI